MHMSAFSYSSFGHFVQMKEFISWLLFLPFSLFLLLSKDFRDSQHHQSQPSTADEVFVIPWGQTLAIRPFPLSCLHCTGQIFLYLALICFEIGDCKVPIGSQRRTSCPCPQMLYSVCLCLMLSPVHIEGRTH